VVGVEGEHVRALVLESGYWYPTARKTARETVTAVTWMRPMRVHQPSTQPATVATAVAAANSAAMLSGRVRISGRRNSASSNSASFRP
jgi:hypothetical protein